MGTERIFENVECDGKIVRIEFVDKTQTFDCFKIEEIEAIIFDDSEIDISFGEYGNLYEATQEDFDLLKRRLSTSKKFVACGSNAMFNLDQVVSFSKGSSKNSIEVECKHDLYKIQLNKLEEANVLVSAIQKRWQKTFTEWDQNRDSADIEEDTLIK